MKPETLFRRRVLKWIKENLKYSYVITIQQLSKVGDPDIVICGSGRFIALELKAKGGKLTKLQDYKLGKIVLAGGRAYVADPDNWPGIQERLLRHDEGYF